MKSVSKEINEFPVLIFDSVIVVLSVIRSFCANTVMLFVIERY